MEDYFKIIRKFKNTNMNNWRGMLKKYDRDDLEKLAQVMIFSITYAADTLMGNGDDVKSNIGKIS